MCHETSSWEVRALPQSSCWVRRLISRTWREQPVSPPRRSLWPHHVPAVLRLLNAPYTQSNAFTIIHINPVAIAPCVWPSPLTSIINAAAASKLCYFLTLFDLPELWLPPTWTRPAAGPTLFSQSSSRRKNTTAKQTFLRRRSEDAPSIFIIYLVLLTE